MEKHMEITTAMRELKSMLRGVNKNDSAYLVSYENDVWYVAFGYEGRIKIESMVEKTFYEWGYDSGIEDHGKSYKVFEYTHVAKKEMMPHTYRNAKRSLIGGSYVRRLMELEGEPLVSYSLQ